MGEVTGFELMARDAGLLADGLGIGREGIIGEMRSGKPRCRWRYTRDRRGRSLERSVCGSDWVDLIEILLRLAKTATCAGPALTVSEDKPVTHAKPSAKNPPAPAR